MKNDATKNRLSVCKYWFANQTKRFKIRPNQPNPAPHMNEEISKATELAKDPSSISLATYAWVLLLATWGGIVRVIREVKLGGKSWQQILAIFVVEIIISTFAGVITFFMCYSSNVSPLYTAVMTSIAGYMGGRALNVLEAIYKAKAGKGEQ